MRCVSSPRVAWVPRTIQKHAFRLVTEVNYHCYYITASNNHNYTHGNIPKMEKIHITLIFECYYFKYFFIGVVVIFGFF